MRLLLLAACLLPCVGYPTLNRADQNVLLSAIPAHIGNSEALPPLDGRPFNAMMVHAKPLRDAAEMLITITYRDGAGAVNYAWRWVPVVGSRYEVIVLPLPADATVESVDTEGFDEHRNGLWWSGFTPN
jgi:hypothetical protein